MRFLKYTIDTVLFGISIPTASFPGIGASIRTPAAARWRAMSSERFAIERTLTPISGCSSYLVTVGPQHIFMILVLTPKFARVSTSLTDVCFSSSVTENVRGFGSLWRKLMGGKQYTSSGFGSGST